MDVLHLSIVFPVIVAVIWLKKPLFVAMIGGIAATIILFRANLKDAAVVLGRQTMAWDMIDVLLSFYLIMFLQLMLEKKRRLASVRDPSSRLFRNHRVNIIVSPATMGLLPSAAAVIVYADTVDRTCGEYMGDKNKTFVPRYYRHIPEMSPPTFPAVLLGLTSSGQNVGVFVLTMIPMVVAVCLVAYITYLEGIPRETSPLERTISKKAGVINLVRNLWTLIAMLSIIIIFSLFVCIATPLVIAPNYIFDHFSLKNLLGLMVGSAESILLGNMCLIIFFKGILSYTGVTGFLPGFTGQLPISMTMSFSLLFFIGTIISGSQIVIALCMPMAFLAFPQRRIPFLVVLMSIAWTIIQISPIHVCFFIAADFYHTTLRNIVMRALGPVIIFSIIVCDYGLLLGQIFYQRIYKQELIMQGEKIWK